mgnify:CR=1 FL=1
MKFKKSLDNGNDLRYTKITKENSDLSKINRKRMEGIYKQGML